MPHRAMLAMLAVVALACSGTTEPRPTEDRLRGIRYDVPSGWAVLGGELRSPARTVVAFEIFDLVGAERRFVADLPESIIPQLVLWADSRYIFDGEVSREAATISGEPALLIRYAVRVRPEDPAANLLFWVVRHEQRLVLVRAVLSAKAPPEDEAAARGIAASLGFIHD